MVESADFEVGQSVEFQKGKTGIVRYIGEIHVAAGQWLGVELEDASGKNDGEVKGQRYFECRMNHGMFIKQEAATIVEEATPRPFTKSNGHAVGLGAKGRPHSGLVGGLKRQSMADPTASKRQSMNAASPTPGARTPAAARSITNSRSPTKPLSTTSSGRGTPHTTVSKPVDATPNIRSSLSGRRSMGPSQPITSRAPRPSMTGTISGDTRSSSRPTSSAIRTNVSQPKGHQSQSSVSGDSHPGGPSDLDSLDEEPENDVLSPSSSGQSGEPARALFSPPLSTVSMASRDLKAPRLPAPHDRAAPITASSITQNRKIEELETRLRSKDKELVEHKEKLKTSEKDRGERERLANIIARLESKLQPQQQELTKLKKQVKEAEERAEISEKQQAENDSATEMAALDREMAEETAESARQELDDMRQKHEELVLEVEVLREENAELGQEMSPEEKTSQNWLRMVQTNEKLRDALVQLRDITHDQETEFRAHIEELEQDVEALGVFKAQYEDTKTKLEQIESVSEELRQQLDSALGAEDMIEELTEKNMTLNEQLDDLKTTVEELESLKELNDELELNHTETEKQMQEEIDYKDSILSKVLRKSAAQDEDIEELEYTVTRFRELVSNLQADLEDIRSSQQLTEAEANELTSKSRAMMDLNMRLQTSASKTQIKAIDLELRRLEAQEWKEHLSIVQLFLPESYSRHTTSVSAFLCIQRVGFKSTLLHTFLKERVNGQASPGHEDEMFACCEILGKLTWVTAMSDRFTNFFRSCSLEDFKGLANAVLDLEPVERNLDRIIDALKNNDLRERQVLDDLQRSIAVMVHVAEVHIPDGLEQYPEDVKMRVLLVHSNLENAAAVLTHIKAMAASSVSNSDEDDVESLDSTQELFYKAETLMPQMRSAKSIINKALHQLDELRSRSLTLDPSTMTTIEQSQSSVSDLFSFVHESGISLFNLLHEEGRTRTATAEEITRALCPSDMTPLSTLGIRLENTLSLLQNLYSLTTKLARTVEFPSPNPYPPWQLLAQDMLAAVATSASFEHEARRLKEEVASMHSTLTMKDRAAEEVSVKVSVLEKRVGESGIRRERIRELENIVEGNSAREQEATNKMLRLQQALRNLEAERDALKKATPLSGADLNGDIRPNASKSRGGLLDGAPPSGLPSYGVNVQQISLLKAEISALQSTIRYLRYCQSSASNSHLSSAYDFLSTPLVRDAGVESVEPSDLAHEARGVFKELLNVVTHPENQVVKLAARNKEDRLSWRPMRECSKWKVCRQVDEWEAWREWKAEVSKRGEGLRAEGERKRDASGREGGNVAGRMEFRLPAGFELGGDGNGKGGQGREVRIVRPDDWDELERGLGVA